MKRLLILCIIIVLSLMQSVLAVPPVQVSSTESNLQIAYPQYQFIKINTDFNLSIHVYNVTTYITGLKADCFIDIYNPRGGEVCHSQMIPGSSDYSLHITANNFTSYGQSSFIIQCNTTSQTGFASGIFEVTNSGIELTVGRAVIDLGLLLLLVIFLIGCVVLFMENDSVIAESALIGGGYLLLIAITFVSWNMAKDFITSNMFIAEMFRILFFVLIAGLFPLFIGGFAYFVIKALQVKEIEDLVTHGLSEGEASERVRRKR